jgi:hypothetical protein
MNRRKEKGEFSFSTEKGSPFSLSCGLLNTIAA